MMHAYQSVLATEAFVVTTYSSAGVYLFRAHGSVEIRQKAGKSQDEQRCWREQSDLCREILAPRDFVNS